ncbi:MAG: hypothetical protein PHW26_02060 [Eubacteriales bacterium]|nr:hypothetical protein [Eubacteriales bacterium]
MDTQTTVYVDPQDAEKNKLFGILAYIPFLFLIPLFAAPDSKFSKYHANQGLLLTIVAVILWIIQKIINSIIVRVMYRNILRNPFGYAAGGGFASTVVGLIVWAVITILAIIGIISANKGECKPLPVIGKFNLINK